MHGSTFTGAGTVTFPENFTHHFIDVASLGNTVAVPAMRRSDKVFISQMFAYTYGDGLLSGIEMDEAVNITRQVLRVQALFEWVRESESHQWKRTHELDEAWRRGESPDGGPDSRGGEATRGENGDHGSGPGRRRLREPFLRLGQNEVFRYIKQFDCCGYVTFGAKIGKGHAIGPNP